MQASYIVSLPMAVRAGAETDRRVPYSIWRASVWLYSPFSNTATLYYFVPLNFQELSLILYYVKPIGFLACSSAAAHFLSVYRCMIFEQ
ncbi:hypothetical protein F5X98DRAFT_52437 [Xylaria grammica]|nr:hypothetical protein F5X98DRAFT_52437 [Xylaria grammica]